MAKSGKLENQNEWAFLPTTLLKPLTYNVLLTVLVHAGLEKKVALGIIRLLVLPPTPQLTHGLYWVSKRWGSEERKVWGMRSRLRLRVIYDIPKTPSDASLGVCHGHRRGPASRDPEIEQSMRNGRDSHSKWNDLKREDTSWNENELLIPMIDKRSFLHLSRLISGMDAVVI